MSLWVLVVYGDDCEARHFGPYDSQGAVDVAGAQLDAWAKQIGGSEWSWDAKEIASLPAPPVLPEAKV